MELIGLTIVDDATGEEVFHHVVSPSFGAFGMGHVVQQVINAGYPVKVSFAPAKVYAKPLTLVYEDEREIFEALQKRYA